MLSTPAGIEWCASFEGGPNSVRGQLCARIYKPSLHFFERAPQTHLEIAIRSEVFATKLEPFAFGSTYYLWKRYPKARFQPLNSINPATKMPLPLRAFPAFFEMRIGGLAGIEMIGSGHIERCMSTFPSMQGSRKRNVREPLISLEVRSPTCAEARTAMGIIGWSRVYSRCEPLQQKLKAGFYIGDETAAFIRKLITRQRKARKRNKAIDYEQKDRSGQFLFDNGMAATGNKRKHHGKERQKVTARDTFDDESESAPSGIDDDDPGDNSEEATRGSWDPHGGECDECFGIEGESRVAACIGCAVTQCERCITALGGLAEPFECAACIEAHDAASDADDDQSSVPEDLSCSVCQRADNDASMLICDGCAEGFHFECIGLQTTPATEEWYCSDCSSVIRAEMWLKRKGLDQQE